MNYTLSVCPSSSAVGGGGGEGSDKKCIYEKVGRHHRESIHTQIFISIYVTDDTRRNVFLFYCSIHTPGQTKARWGWYDGARAAVNPLAVLLERLKIDLRPRLFYSPSEKSRNRTARVFVSLVARGRGAREMFTGISSLRAHQE